MPEMQCRADLALLAQTVTGAGEAQVHVAVGILAAVCNFCLKQSFSCTDWGQHPFQGRGAEGNRGRRGRAAKII